MHKNIYKNALILLSILVISTSVMGCTKQQKPKSEVSKVEESLAVSNSYNIAKMDDSSKALTGTSDEKKDEVPAAIDNKNQKTEEGTKVQQTINTSAGEEKSPNSTATAASTRPSTSTSNEAALQPSSTAASQTGAQQNQGTTAGTNQGQASQIGSGTTPTSGGTTQAGGGTTQPSGDTTQSGGGTITPGNDPKSEPPKLKPSAPTGDQVVSYASNFVNTPCQFGGTTPDGFDASGFVQYVFNHFKIEVGRTIYQQYKAGTSVSKNQLQPGDIVFFGSEQSPHHVGIYVGNNSFIHATQTGDVVEISPLTRSDFVGARRVI